MLKKIKKHSEKTCDPAAQKSKKSLETKIYNKMDGVQR
jgi:hypothetical protein